MTEYTITTESAGGFTTLVGMSGHSYRDGVHLVRCPCGWVAARRRLKKLIQP